MDDHDISVGSIAQTEALVPASAWTPEREAEVRERLAADIALHGIDGNYDAEVIYRDGWALETAELWANATADIRDLLVELDRVRRVHAESLTLLRLTADTCVKHIGMERHSVEAHRAAARLLRSLADRIERMGVTGG